MKTAEGLFRRIFGLLMTVAFVSLPAALLFATRQAVLQFTVSEWIAQFASLGGSGLVAQYSYPQVISHIFSLGAWLAGCLLWLLLVVKPTIEALGNLAKARKSPMAHVEAAGTDSGGWSMKVATWALSLALFGVAGQASAQTSGSDLQQVPVMLDSEDLEAPEEAPPETPTLFVKQGEHINAALTKWLASHHPDLASQMTDSDMERWAQQILAQNPSANWSNTGHLDKVSAFVIRIGALPNPGGAPVVAQEGLEDMVSDLLAGKISWDEVSAQSEQAPVVTGLMASVETGQALISAAEQAHTIIPAGAPTMNTWVSEASETGGGTSIPQIFQAAGSAVMVVAGGLWRSLQAFRVSARPKVEKLNLPPPSEDERRAIARLSSLASNDPSEVLSAVTRSLMWSARPAQVPSLSALMVNMADGNMAALLIPGDPAFPRPGTPWFRSDDKNSFVWASSIENHQANPEMLEELKVQIDPYPCLVNIGDFPEGGSLWIDLEVFNNVHVRVRDDQPDLTGEDKLEQGLVTMWSWAVELLTSHGSGAEVITCGFGKDLEKLGARYYPSLNGDAMDYIGQRLRDHYEHNIPSELEGKPASHLRAMMDHPSALAPLIVFVPLPPEDPSEDHDSKLWDSANYFDRRVLTCVFGYDPPASKEDTKTKHTRVTVQADPDGTADSHILSVNRPNIEGLKHQVLSDSARQSIDSVLERHYRILTKPPKKARQSDRLAVASISVPAREVVPTVMSHAEPEYFHLRLFGDPQFIRGGEWEPLRHSDLEMISFLAAANRTVTLEELSWVTRGNYSQASSMYVLARSNLGHDPETRLFLSHEGYGIGTSRFTCDLHQFSEIHDMLLGGAPIGDSKQRAKAAKAALSLLDGRPFGSFAMQWSWTHNFPDAAWGLLAKVDRMVHAYAQAAAKVQNWHEVMWATSRGMRTNSAPCSTCTHLAAEAADHSGQGDLARLVRQLHNQKVIEQDLYLPRGVAAASE